MALSYETNWDTCQYLDYPATPSFFLPDLMDMELQQTLSLDHYNFPCIDSIFDTTIENYNNQYSYPYLYPYQTLNESKPYLYDNLIDFSTHVEKPSCLCNGHVGFSTNPRKRPYESDGPVEYSAPADKLQCLSNDFTDFSTDIEKLPFLTENFVDFSTTVDRLPEFQCPPVFNIGSGGGTGGGTLSAQSVAARQRRRKITERTQELGKLVPGGNKMNTAEMFGAAYDYIKYLQAQVGILQSLGSKQEKEQEQEQLVHSEELHKLALSSKVQEKLYSRKKCLVPIQLVESLANDHELQNSNPVIGKEIRQLIRKSG